MRMKCRMCASTVNNLATDSNNSGEYTAFTDSAMSQAEAWSPLSCLKCINFEWIFSRSEFTELFKTMYKIDFCLPISFRHHGTYVTNHFH